MRVTANWLWLATLLAILVWGLEQVALAPLETGEVYPPYSSLRSDPLGARALYESLEGLPGIAVERLYKRRAPLENAARAMFVLGVYPIGWTDDKTLEEYEKLTHDGGRLVIAFLPVRRLANTPLALEKRWHVKLTSEHPPGVDPDGKAIPRRSALYFDPGPEWRILARRDDRATAVERGLGAGTIVLVADSYPLSNEGLREARDASFIARLVGPAHDILFDENHFGVTETGSVTTLMRKYRLEGAVAMLVLVAALFLWRSASSFLPPRETAPSGVVAGRDSLEGLSALLRRGVPDKELFDACVAEWAKSQRGAAAERMDAIARLGKNDPVQAYRAACRVLTERK
jgi:hypothetical protein